MTNEEACRFVREWLAAWNAGDAGAVLAHFAEDVTFSSPLAAALDISGGIVRGKEALRAYWLTGLEHHPDLHFELIGVYLGVDTLVINYRNQAGDVVNEVLKFDGPSVIEGHVTHRARATLS